MVFASPLSPHPSRALLARHARREPWPPPPTATAAPRAITLSFPKPSTPARPPPPSDPPKPVRPSQSPPASRRRGTEPRRPPASRGAPTSGLLLPQRSPGTGSSNPSEAHRPKPSTPCRRSAAADEPHRRRPLVLVEAPPRTTSSRAKATSRCATTSSCPSPTYPTPPEPLLAGKSCVLPPLFLPRPRTRAEKKQKSRGPSAKTP